MGWRVDEFGSEVLKNNCWNDMVAMGHFSWLNHPRPPLRPETPGVEWVEVVSLIELPNLSTFQLMLLVEKTLHHLRSVVYPIIYNVL